MIFTFAKVLINVATAIDEAYYEGKENEVDLHFIMINGCLLIKN
jgi:hypothetical protein